MPTPGNPDPGPDPDELRDDDLDAYGPPDSSIEENLPAPPVSQPFYHLVQLAMHREVTRRRLAYLLMGLLGILSAGSGLLLSTNSLSLDEADRYLSIVFPPVVALAGTALGFFFAGREN